MKKSSIATIAFIAILVVLRMLFPERSTDYKGPRALLDSFFALGLLASILLLAGALGKRVQRWLRFQSQTSLEQALFSLAIGLGILAYGVLALGLVGLLHPLAVALWLILAAVWTWQDWREITQRLLDNVAQIPVWWRDRTRAEKVVLLSAGIILTLTILQALTPPWDYDGLMYHLKAPRIFLDEGRIHLLPDIWQANAPLTSEMLFAIGLSFGSDTFARLIHVTYGCIFILATFALGYRFLSAKTGWVAAAILLGIPILPVWTSWAYTDLAWATYEFLAVYALVLWINRGGRDWLIVSGLMSGLALGNKYLAFGNAALLGLWVLWQSRGQPGRQVISNCLYFGGTALLVACPWYLKNWFLAGNPIYPFVFGGPGWDPFRLEMLMTYLRSFGTGQGWLSYLLLPFSIYLRSDLFSTFSIEVPSLLFPLALFYPWKRGEGKLNNLAVYTGLWFLIWATGSQQVRFLLPIFPPLAILSSATLLNLIKHRWQTILVPGLIGGVLLSALLYQWLYLSYTQPVEVVLGIESKADFLLRTPQDHTDYAAFQFIRTNLNPTDRVLMLWYGRSYYCDQRCLPDADQSQWQRLVRENRTVEQTALALRTMGITHLFFSRGDVRWFLLYHDPTGLNRQAVSFFKEEFQPVCAQEIYQDSVVSIYELTCP